MKKKNHLVSFVSVLLLSGCWTVRETEHSVAPIAALPAGSGVRLQIAGFEATVMSYDAVYGYTTVTGGGRPWCDHWPSTTYSTTTFVPRVSQTSVYRDRATDSLERAGCLLKAQDPSYRVEVRFEGPYSEAGDGWASFGWMVCTLFMAEYSGQTWRAQLRIHDLKSGKLILSRELSRRDEAVVWGLIPFVSASSSERTSGRVMQHLCLTELTDAAVAEIVSFFAKNR